MRRTDPGALGLALAAGASAWLSLGSLAVIHDSGASIGALPSLWALAPLIAAPVLLAWLGRLRTAEAWPLALTAVLWWPWLPAPVPHAALVWEGPLEALVWTAALGGVLCARIARARLERFVRGLALIGDPKRAPWTASALALVVSLACAWGLQQQLPAGDEPHYLVITQSLLSDGDLRIQNNHDRGDYFAYSANPLFPDFLKRGGDGEIYSIHAPGVSVLVLPAFWLAGYAGAVMTLALICALGVAAMWRAAYLMTSDAAAAWAGTLAVAASAPWVVHSVSIFPDAVGGAIVAASAALLIRLGVSRSLEARPGLLMAAGLLLGVLPWLHTRFAILSAALGLVLGARLLGRPDRWRALIAFGAGPALLALAWFSYFERIYGTVNPAVPYGGSQQNAWMWIGRGFTGLAVDQQFGLLASAPAILYLVPSLWRFVQARPRLAGELLLTAVPYVALVASFGMWWGGWSAPARFLVPVLPLAVPILAHGWLTGGRAWRWTFGALVLIGFANLVARVVLLDGLLMYNTRDGSDLLLDWLARSIDISLAVPSVHRTGGAVALTAAAIWASMTVAACAGLAGSLRTRVRSFGASWALTGLWVLVVTMLGMTAVWWQQGLQAVTPESSEAEFVRRWDPSWRPVMLRLPERHRVRHGQALASLSLHMSGRTRDVKGPDVLFAAAWLPAGEYAVLLEGPSRLSGTLAVAVGLTSQAIETWALDGVAPGVTTFRMRLPARAHSVVVRGDTAARASLTRVGLRPLVVDRRPIAADRYVIRASRFGAARVFLLDDEVYLEPGGLWTRGNATARVALTSAEPGVEVILQAGPVPTQVELEAGSWRATAALAPGEQSRLSVPANQLLAIHTGAWFRPVDQDPESRDPRRLGVRLEFPEPSQ
ncbi:MAG: hypothetical protein ACT4QD_20945 [Acidobacteriota bacterium]